ncbi:MAG: inositol monophosphatase, partial [Alphaproteobacteria bacterium]
FVTAADLKAESILREELEKARGGYTFVLEEAGEITGVDQTHRWIVDPLDGTTNFLHGIPHFAISIALEREGELVAAVILNPVTDELYWSERGKGAYLNDHRLRVSSRRDTTDCVVATGIPHLGRPGQDEFLREMDWVMPRVAGVRRMGAAALDLAYVAAGRYDGFWERNLAIWDIAAGVLLVREAGGIVTDPVGKPRALETGHILATNGQIQAPMVDLLKKAASA